MVIFTAAEFFLAQDFAARAKRLDSCLLFMRESKELKTMHKAFAVTNDGSREEGFRRRRQRTLERYHFSGWDFGCQNRPHTAMADIAASALNLDIALFEQCRDL